MFVPVLKTILEDPVREALEDNENNDKIFDLAVKWPLEKPLEKLTLRPVKERKPTPPAFLTLSPEKSNPPNHVISVENIIKDLLSPEEKMLLASLSNDSGSMIHVDENNNIQSSSISVSASGSVAAVTATSSSRPTKWNQVANFFKTHLKRSKDNVSGDKSKAASTKSSNSGSTTPKARNSPKEILKSIFGGSRKGKKKNLQESIVSSNTSSSLRNDDADEDAVFMKEEMGQVKEKEKKKIQSVTVEPLQKPALFISEAPVKISDFSDEQNLDYARWERRNDFIAFFSGTKQFCKEFAAKYKVKQLLGDGAFGFVVVAETIKDKKEVRKKLLYYHLTNIQGTCFLIGRREIHDKDPDRQLGQDQKDPKNPG